MITVLKESDWPKSFREKIAEFIGRPPKPLIRFEDEPRWDGNTLHFAVRGGLPLPLLYDIYVEADGSEAERADFMHAFSLDRWAVAFDKRPSRVEIRVGIVPFEILGDRRIITV